MILLFFVSVLSGLGSLLGLAVSKTYWYCGTAIFGLGPIWLPPFLCLTARIRKHRILGRLDEWYDDYINFFQRRM